MSDDFYRAFEDRFRGSRELILERLHIYLPLIQPLRDLQPQPTAIDLGCGRGEWLELITAQGYQAQGIDLDDGMLAACRERGLEVHTGDALEALRALPDASQSLVTGFHIAEHLPFDQLRQLVTEAERTLRPGGLLILETPNPENLVIGTSGFYLDPTHRHPLPPPLLDFLARHAGFSSTLIMRLQASAAVAEEEAALTLMDVLGGASPDYAVVAQKAGAPELEAALLPAFRQGSGPDLTILAARYQQQLEQRLTDTDRQLAEARATIDHQLAEARRAIDGQLAEARAEAVARTAELQAVYASRSWRITGPLRRAQRQWANARARGLSGTLKALGKGLAVRFRPRSGRR